MTKYRWIIFDVFIIVMACVMLLLSYILESYRVAVFVIGLAFFVLLGSGVVTYIMSLKKHMIPIALPILFTILLVADSVVYQDSSISNEYDYTLLISIIFSLILSFITIFFVHRKFFLEKILPYIGNTVFYFFLAFLAMMYMNYCFDMTQTTKEYFVISGEPSNYTRSIEFYGTLEYPVEYLGDNSDVAIPTLELKTNYEFHIGDHIEVEWRRGLFSNLYRVDYSNLKINGETFP